MQKKDYLKNRVDEQVEVAGHVLEAHVRPTLELVRHDSGQQLKRRFDPESGLALIDLGEN